MMTVRRWLRANNYDDVADLIDDIMREWSNRGVKTRRIGGWSWQEVETEDH
jgi:hypothetical protein